MILSLVRNGNARESQSSDASGIGRGRTLGHRRVDRLGCGAAVSPRGQNMRHLRPPFGYRRRYYNRGTSSAWGGMVILAIGVVLLLDRLGIVYARDIFQFWPMLLVAAGLTWLSRATSLVGRMIGGLTVAGGLLVQADNLGYLRL